jgi:hypothetical protein
MSRKKANICNKLQHFLLITFRKKIAPGMQAGGDWMVA